MNILLISYDYPPYKGGMANLSYQVAYQLNKMGEKIIVVAQKTKGDREFDKDNRFLTYRRTNIFFLRELALILLLPYLYMKYRIDIIYNVMWCQGGFAAFLTNRFLNIPYILHTHGSELVEYKRTLFDKIKYGLFYEQYKRLIFKNAKRIVAVSNYTKEILVRFGVREDKVNLISVGVDINRFKPNLEISPIVLKHNLNNKRILLTVSRLDDYKGHDIVIKLMPQLLKRVPDLVYLIVGSGKNRNFLELLTKRLNLQKNIIFAGYVDESSLPLYYNVCDIFIMLTGEELDRARFEGYGLVFLEANSCCKPVIGARTGGIPDAIADGKTGYLVDPDNGQEITDKITLLLEDRELAKRLGQEGRQRIVEEGLTWESISKKMLNILATEVKGKKYVKG